MSSAFAIAAVTARLRNLLAPPLEQAFPDLEVTTLSLHRANETIPDGGRVNLCLYEISQSTPWRNGDLPWQSRPGEIGKAPLALNLYYLLTVFQGRSQPAMDNGLPAYQQQLGLAMRILHDHPVFHPEELNALLTTLGEDYPPIENIRLSYEPLPLDQLLRLFESSQTPHAVSVAYQATVVLIQSRQSARTPLPVLTIGPNDRGVRVEPSLIPPFATLTALELPPDQTSLQIDQTLILRGHHLHREAGSSARFRPVRQAEDVVIPLSASDHTTEISLPIGPEEPWVAGFYNVSVEVVQDGEPRRSNELAFALTPRIDSLTLNPPQPTAEAPFTITLTVTPAIQPHQQVSLLFGDRAIPPLPPGDFPTTTLTFNVEAPAAGRYFIRLRVDGVDSALIVRTPATPQDPSRLSFDPTREVIVV